MSSRSYFDVKHADGVFWRSVGTVQLIYLWNILDRRNCANRCSGKQRASLTVRRYVGKGRGQIGFDREIYYHCLRAARRDKFRNALFDVYPDERSISTELTVNKHLDRLKEMMNRGLKRAQ